MATTYKSGKVAANGSIGTYSTLYSTSASAEAVISSLLIVNTASVGATVRVGIMGSEGTPSGSDWIIYDYDIAANDTVILTMGIALASSEFIRVSADASTVTFRAFVSEIT